MKNSFHSGNIRNVLYIPKIYLSLEMHCMYIIGMRNMFPFDLSEANTFALESELFFIPALIIFQFYDASIPRHNGGIAFLISEKLPANGWNLAVISNV